MSSIWKWVSHRSRLNEVLGEQKGGRMEGMRTGFTSQNMTGPFPSVSYRIVFFVTGLIFHVVMLQYFTNLFKRMLWELCSRSSFTAVSYAPWFFCSHRFPGVKVQLPDVLQGFTDNMVGNVHLIDLPPLHAFLLSSHHYMQTLRCRRQCVLTALINTSPPPQIFSQPV